MIKYLIVDDETVERNGIRSLIQNRDPAAKVICATDGENALEIVRDGFAPDIAVTDVRMPFMDGLTFAEKLLQMYPSVEIIICSAYDEFEYARSAMRLGINEYLLKPVMQNELYDALDRASARQILPAPADQAEESSDNNSRLVRQVKRIIQSQYSQDIGLDSIALQMQKTPGYISSVFQKETGLTPTKYLTRYRMEAAAGLLIHTDMKIADIAHMVGYVNVSYFGTVFRGTFGFTPLNYRERYAE